MNDKSSIRNETDNEIYSREARNPGKVKIQSNAMNEDRTNENLK